MISIPGSLSFAKFVSRPCKICGGCQIRVPRSIHSCIRFNQRCTVQSVLAVRSFFVERNDLYSLAFTRLYSTDAFSRLLVTLSSSIADIFFSLSRLTLYGFCYSSEFVTGFSWKKLCDFKGYRIFATIIPKILNLWMRGCTMCTSCTKPQVCSLSVFK